MFIYMDMIFSPNQDNVLFRLSLLYIKLFFIAKLAIISDVRVFGTFPCRHVDTFSICYWILKI